MMQFGELFENSADCIELFAQLLCKYVRKQGNRSQIIQLHYGDEFYSHPLSFA